MKILSPGALSLVQDLGRSGYQRYGVSVSGAMDQEALLIGNLLVGNEIDAAGVEVMFGGAEFLFTEESVVAVTGCDLELSLDGTKLSTWQSFIASSGSVLRLGSARTGLRAYVTVSGGIESEPVLGSRSTHVSSGIGGLAGKPLVDGDELALGTAHEEVVLGAKFPDHLRLTNANEFMVRVVAGPQKSSFTEEGTNTFLSSAFTVTDRSDRQGLRLDGPVIEAVDGRYDIISDAVVFGAIQVPGDGKPIALLADRQTTGGYAKIAVVATVDLPLLTQAMPGTVVHFEEITVQEAQRLMRDRRTAILNADFTSALESHIANVVVGSEEVEIGVGYRPEEVRKPEGDVVTVSIDGSRLSARVEEMVT